MRSPSTELPPDLTAAIVDLVVPLHSDAGRSDSEAARSTSSRSTDDANDACASPAMDEQATRGVAAPPRPRARRRRNDDRRREQNRLTVQRFYYRRKQTLERLREEEAKLAEEFSQLSQRVRETTVVDQQSEFTQLILLRETLQHQNALLQRMVGSQSKLFEDFGRRFHSKVQQLENSNASGASSADCTLEFIPLASQRECQERIEHSLQEIAALESAFAATASMRGASATPEGTGAGTAPFPVGDWTCQFDAHASFDSMYLSAPWSKSSPAFIASKQLDPLCGADPLTLAQRTLALWTNSPRASGAATARFDPTDADADARQSALHAQLFPNNMSSSLRVLQQVDDSTWIVLQTIEREQASEQSTSFESAADPAGGMPTAAPATSAVQTILQVSLVSLGESAKHIVVIRSVPHEHYELESRSTAPPQWIDVFNWCAISQTTASTITSNSGGVGDIDGIDSVVSVTWGGRMASPSLAQQQQQPQQLSGLVHTSAFEWLIYELARAHRWETVLAALAMENTSDEDDGGASESDDDDDERDIRDTRKLSPSASSK